MVGADGDVPAQGCDAGELATLLAYAERRSRVRAVMAAQAMLNDVVLQIQRRRFGIPGKDGYRSPAA